jgi:hypothetical protein
MSPPAPNKGLQRTALCAEQDRGDFETWNQLEGLPDLAARRR